MSPELLKGHRNREDVEEESFDLATDIEEPVAEQEKPPSLERRNTSAPPSESGCPTRSIVGRPSVIKCIAGDQSELNLAETYQSCEFEKLKHHSSNMMQTGAVLQSYLKPSHIL